MTSSVARSWRLSFLGMSAFSLALASPSPSQAAGKPGEKADKKECVAAYEDAQRLRKESRLAESRERLLVCAQDGCPAIVRRDCTQWITELELSTPTIVLEAIGDGGHDLFDVRVSLDGKPLGDRLDGKAVSVDPGPHVVRFERAGAAPIEEKVLAREGEKNRKVVARFGTAAAEQSAPVIALAADPHKASTPAAVYVLGGVGVLGLGAFAYFGALGLSAKSDLDANGCKPNCSQSEVERAKRRFLIADVGLGVGVVALGLATILYFTRGEATPSAPATAWRLDVAPTAGGAAAGVSGSF